MLTSGPDLFIHSRPQHREGRRSGRASVPTCNRSGGLTRKPLSIVLNWSIQFFIRQRGLVALSMKLSEYQDLYAKLSTAEDIDFLAENFGHDKELLLVIYTQRIVRETTKKFYRVKAQARRLAFMWQNGSSLLEIARKFEFPPILTALMVLEQRKISRKQYWIESKATFGYPYEIRRHLCKQLQPYSDMFGDGAVVYWFGHVDDQKYEPPEGVDIVSPTFFETPPLPFPYEPVGERRVENPTMESKVFTRRE